MLERRSGPSPRPGGSRDGRGHTDVPVYREWIGTLDGSENAEIRARVTGYLVKRDYQEGGLVKKGDVLFEIDPRPSRPRWPRPRASWTRARRARSHRKRSAERSKGLFEKRAISEKEYINKTQLNEASLSKIGALQANVEEAQLNLDFCKVTSPVEGIAGISKAQVGDLVGTADSAVLTSVSTLDPLKILFPISEIGLSRRQSAGAGDDEQADRATAGNHRARPRRRFDFSAKGPTAFGGSAGEGLDRHDPRHRARCRIRAACLRPGFFARARIVAKVLKDAVVVPQRAVSEVQGSYQIGDRRRGREGGDPPGASRRRAPARIG